MLDETPLSVRFSISGFMVYGEAVRMVISVIVEFDSGFLHSVVVVDSRCWCRDFRVRLVLIRGSRSTPLLVRHLYSYVSDDLLYTVEFNSHFHNLLIIFQFVWKFHCRLGFPAVPNGKRNTVECGERPPQTVGLPALRFTRPYRWTFDCGGNRLFTWVCLGCLLIY